MPLGFWKRQPADAASGFQTREYSDGEGVLPGIAGYQQAGAPSSEPLPKGAMPQVRFKYVAPAAKRDQ